MKPDIEWIAAGLSKPGKTKGGLAAALGRAPSMVTALLAGEREIKAREIPIIAAYLEVEPPGAHGELVEVAEGLVPVRVQGSIEAGAWRSVDAFDDVQEERVFDARDPDFPQERLFASDVAGDSMNDLRPRPIMPGDRIIWVRFDDLGGRVPLRDGMVVVVEQRKDGGALQERSVKQLEIYDDHYALQPRSTNPRHKPIIVERDLQADDGRSVEIIGLVRKTMNTIPISHR